MINFDYNFQFFPRPFYLPSVHLPSLKVSFWVTLLMLRLHLLLALGNVRPFSVGRVDIVKSRGVKYVVNVMSDVFFAVGSNKEV